MRGQFRYPNIRGTTDREQLAEIRKFLYQLVDELNHSGGEDKDDDAGGSVSGVTQENAEQIARNAATQALYTVTLKEAAWTEAEACWVQPVPVPSVTAGSKAELLPDRQTAAALWKAGCLLTVENAGNAIVIYASGRKPAGDITLQVSVTRAKLKG